MERNRLIYIILPILFVTLVELDDYLLHFTILKERQKEEIGRGKTFIFLKRELLIWLGVRAVFFWFSFYRSVCLCFLFKLLPVVVGGGRKERKKYENDGKGRGRT